MLRLITLGALRLERDGNPIGADVRPRRLALLAILAAAGPNGMTRDGVLGVLWAESDPERARHSLNQALYTLRRELGDDVVLATPGLQLDPTQITSDVQELRDAVASEQWDRAPALYAGPFLNGFYIADAPEFERWVDDERARAQKEAFRAIEAAAKQAERDNRLERAVALWDRLTILDPLNGRFAVAHLEGVLKTGDRAGAMAIGRAHEDRVREELGVEPDEALTVIMNRLREATPRAAAPPPRPFGPVAKAPRSSDHQMVLPAPRRSSRVRQIVINLPRHTGRAGWMVAAVLLVVAVGGAVWRRTVSAGESPNTATTASRAVSPVASRLVDDGRRALYQRDGDAAKRLFSRALEDDPAFGMAAYFAWRAEVTTNGVNQDSLASRALALASRASARDRLIIATQLAAARFDVHASAMGDSLATRFPDDADALIAAAAASPDLTRATSLLNRAIGIDSAAATALNSLCRACEALEALARRYESADSVAGVEQTLERWSAIRPADFAPWSLRGEYLFRLDRTKEMTAALRRADSLGAPTPASSLADLARLIRLADFDSADVRCRAGLTSADSTELTAYRRWCAISLRTQGRYRDALALLRAGRTPSSTALRVRLPLDQPQMSILEMEMGRPMTAAIDLAEVAKKTTAHAPTPLDGATARELAWMLTLSATASARAADTLRVRRFADSVEVVGHYSADPRDARLHHFLRGTVLSVAGQHDGAVREFRAAMASPTQGYSRINYELGRSLMALRRPADAVAVLRGALRGDIDGPGLALSRTELHELMAQAFDMLGQRDSATVHYDIVERSWRHADAVLAERHATARQWLLRAGRLSP